MAKLEWGKKRTCQNCGAKYYDLQKEPPTCPKCETVFQQETNQRGRRSRSTTNTPKAIPTAAAAVKSTELVANDIDEETLEDEESLEDDESLPEDTSELVGGDDDDMNDVIENVETGRDES